MRTTFPIGHGFNLKGGSCDGGGDYQLFKMEDLYSNLLSTLALILIHIVSVYHFYHGKKGVGMPVLSLWSDDLL